MNTIRGELTTLQTDIGFSILDAALNSDDLSASSNYLASGVFLLGTAGGKLGNLLSSKAKKLCPTGALKCVRALFGRIKTPHGVAKQLDSPEAWKALEAAQSGAPLYRLGKMGTSKASEAQFWSVTNPKKMNPQDFAKAFGIPKANANFDFLIVGRLSPGKNAITRVAPGAGGNPGGGGDRACD